MINKNLNIYKLLKHCLVMIKIVDRFILVGSSHVAKNSLAEIEEAIEKFMPEVVCLELDHVRFKKLMTSNVDKKPTSSDILKSIKEFGAFGFLFANIAGYVQGKIGKKLGVKPGVDMKTGYLKARELKIPVSLIDQNIKVTLKNLSKLSFFKKISLFGGMFFKGMKKENRELLNFDLKKVPSERVVSKMVDILKKESPLLYDILIEGRNRYMVKRLLKLRELHEGYILAIVGAGHVRGMVDLLDKELVCDTKGLNVSYSFSVE